MSAQNIFDGTIRIFNVEGNNYSKTTLIPLTRICYHMRIIPLTEASTFPIKVSTN